MRKLMNFRAALFLAIFLIAGLCCANFILIGKVVFGVIVGGVSIISISLFCGFYSGNGKLKRNIIFSVCCLLIFIVAFFGLRISVNNYDKPEIADGVYTVEGRVTETNYDGNKLVLSRLKFYLDGATASDYKAVVYVNGNGNADVGDYIRFETDVKNGNSFYEGAVAFERVAERIKYVFTVNASEVSVISFAPTVFERVNLFLRNTLKKGLSSKIFAVAYSMLCGNSEYMDDYVVTPYRNLGIAHVFAVSGLHVGILAAVLKFILDRLKLNRTVSAVAITVLLFFYSGVCGFSSSSLRASIMAGVMLFSGVSGRKYDGLSSLSVAFILVLLFSPAQFFCAGFVLSFTVAAGIILLAAPISKLFGFLPEKVALSIGVILSAQIAGLPASLYFFKEISLIAVLANALLVPFVSAVFILLFASVILAGATTLYPLLIPSEYVLTFIDNLVRNIDGKVFVASGFILGFSVVFYYGFLIIYSGIINLSEILKRVLLSVLLPVFVLSAVFINIYDVKTFKSYVIGSEYFTATLVVKERTSVLIVSSDSGNYNVSRLKRAAQNAGVNRIDKVIMANGRIDEKVLDVLTGIYRYLDVGEVYYVGNSDIYKETLKSYFKSVEFFRCTANANCSDFGEPSVFGVSFVADGKGAKITCDGVTVFAFSTLSGSALSTAYLSGGNVDLLICRDALTDLKEVFKPKIAAIYTDDGSGALNAQSHGNLYFALNRI